MIKQANNTQAVLRLYCSHWHSSWYSNSRFEEEQIKYKLKDWTSKAPNTKIAEFANNVDADESADNEFSSGSREFALKSLIFRQNAVYSFFLNLKIYLGQLGFFCALRVNIFVLSNQLKYNTCPCHEKIYFCICMHLTICFVFVI